MQRVWLGAPNPKYAGLPEIDGRELVTLAPLAVIVVVLGVYPHAVLDLINASLVHLTEIVKAGAATGVAAR
jgi:NADH-quinone oxidoreductase subunit M